MNAKNAAALMSAAWIFGGTLAGGFLLAPAVHAHHDVVTACEEDEPCWDPCTMGNRRGFDADGRWWDCTRPVAHGVAAADGGVPGP